MAHQFQRQAARRRRCRETLLVVDEATSCGPPLTVWEIAERTGRWPGAYDAAIARLRDTGLIVRDGDFLYTTAAGRAAAAALRDERAAASSRA